MENFIEKRSLKVDLTAHQFLSIEDKFDKNDAKTIKIVDEYYDSKTLHLLKSGSSFKIREYFDSDFDHPISKLSLVKHEDKDIKMYFSHSPLCIDDRNHFYAGFIPEGQLKDELYKLTYQNEVSPIGKVQITRKLIVDHNSIKKLDINSFGSDIESYSITFEETNGLYSLLDFSNILTENNVKYSQPITNYKRLVKCCSINS